VLILSAWILPLILGQRSMQLPHECDFATSIVNTESCDPDGSGRSSSDNSSDSSSRQPDIARLRARLQSRSTSSAPDAQEDNDGASSFHAHSVPTVERQSQADGRNVMNHHMSPLDIRFSQKKMQPVFSDGRSVAETLNQIQVVQCKKGEASQYGATWKLKVPFPSIEVIHCRHMPKNWSPDTVKDSSGSSSAMPEFWFTLDNRRLYCLQKAAIGVWPERCVSDVDVLLGPPVWRVSSVRKFRNIKGRLHGFNSMYSGTTISVRSQAGGVGLIEWSWRDGIKPIFFPLCF